MCIKKILNTHKTYHLAKIFYQCLLEVPGIPVKKVRTVTNFCPKLHLLNFANIIVLPVHY